MLNEKIFSIELVDPISIYGVNNEILNNIKEAFPKLKLVARGEFLKVIGSKNDIDEFEDFFDNFINHYETFGKVETSNIKDFLQSKQKRANLNESDILVYGKNGLIIKARTPNQEKIVESLKVNDMVFAIGPAGTGKTYTAVALAVRALKNKEVKRIILTRPAVEAGENLGFLPGDLKDKLDPYLQPLYDALRDMLPTPKLNAYLEDKTIEIAPLAFMRGRTLDNVFAILDEAQNATSNQLKMFLTRMGKNAKFFITGDITQIDLPKNQRSGLVYATEILKDIKGISIIKLDKSDVIRHKLVTEIINAYEKKEDT